MKRVFNTVAAVAVLALGCGSSGGSEHTCTLTPEAVTNGTFDSFRTWQSWQFTTNGVNNSPHTSGPRTVYIKQAPPHGSTEFPIGTIIVKELETGPPASHSIFAMVKRGCGYNAAGATDWEWFELQNQADGSELILWGGSEPPVGESYAGDPTACNTCHAGSRANDYVQSPPLQLSNF